MAVDQAAEQDVMIPSPVLEPFTQSRENACRMCGDSISMWARFMWWLRGSGLSVVKTSFCPGGKASTENRGMMAAIMSGEAEAFNPCAGVTTPHLHVQCKHCGFSYLMRTKGSR
jgi:hypothetical protein